MPCLELRDYELIVDAQQGRVPRRLFLRTVRHFLPKKFHFRPVNTSTPSFESSDSCAFSPASSALVTFSSKESKHPSTQ